MLKRTKAWVLAVILVIVSIHLPQINTTPSKAVAAETFMVYFETGGNGASQVDAVDNIVSGSTVSSLPTPTRDGYTFDGWYETADYTTRFTTGTKITKNMVVYAKWKEKTISSLKAEYASPSAVVGTLLDREKLTVQAVYSDGGTKTLTTAEYELVDSKVEKLGNNTFTVQVGTIKASFTVLGITEPTYSVTFLSNGGSSVAAVTGIKENQTISLPAEPFRIDYEFQGWYLDNNTFTKEFTAEYKITENIIVFAKWEKLEVIIENPTYNLNTEGISLKVNEQKSVFVESYDPGLEMQFFSSNSKVATVNSEGIVEGKKKGKATIYVLPPEGELLECSVVVAGVQAKSIKLNATSKTLSVKKTFQIKTTFSPSNVSSKKLSYTSSNKKVAKVSSTGKVTAVKKGTCYITVKTKDGSNLKKKIKITVK